MSSDPYQVPSNANMFYEMFLVDSDGTLVDVPVLIQNYQDSQGNTPNADSSIGNYGKVQLVRRFFIFDTKSGVEGTGSFASGGISTVVRYPKSITLRLEIDPSNPESIFTPTLIINYLERPKSQILSTNYLTSVSFSSQYL